MFNINIEDMLEMYEVTFEVYIEDKLTNRQIMKAPKDILMANFVQTAKQIKNDNRPIKLKMLRQAIIWNNFENREKALDCFVSISNHAMETWERNKQN